MAKPILKIFCKITDKKDNLNYKSALDKWIKPFCVKRAGRKYARVERGTAKAGTKASGKSKRKLLGLSSAINRYGIGEVKKPKIRILSPSTKIIA